MIKIEEFGATIAIDEFVREYRNVEHFLGFCRECDAYGKTWACPPFEQEFDIEQYEVANLFATKVWVDPAEQEKILSKEELKSKMVEILEPVRRDLDERLLALEAIVPSSRALFAGSCRSCPKGECTRPKGEPCAKPDKMRPSLEALGFDVSRTASELIGAELQWSKDTLPQYFTLIYALLTKGRIL